MEITSKPTDVDEKAGTVRPSSIRRLVVFLVKLAGGGLLMALLVCFGRFDTAVYRALLGGTSLLMIAGVAAGAAAMVLFTLIRWWILLHAQRLPASLLEILRIGCMGCFANLVAPAGMGFEAIRLVYLRQHHRGRVMVGFTTMVMDRLLGLVSLLLLSAVFCCLLLGSNAHRITSQLLLANLLLLGVILFALAVLFDLLPITITQRLGNISWLGNGFVAIREYRNHRRALAVCMLLSFAAHSCMALATWSAIAALRQPVSIVGVFTVTPIVSFARAVSLTPLGLGVNDSVAAVLYPLVGLSHGAEVQMLLRAVQLVLFTACGIAYLTKGSDAGRLKPSTKTT